MSGEPSGPAHPPRPPRIEGYSYVDHVGSGGSSYVYLFSEHTPQRFVAVKMPRTFGPDPKLRDSLVAEANAIAQLEHKNSVVPVLAFKEAADGTPCLIMAYYKAGDLATRVKRGGPLAVGDVLAIGEQLADGIAAAHAIELLHQDIKPANILIDAENSSYRLGDFGIARQHWQGPGTDALSPSWAAPEVFDGQDATKRSDIYSLGATLWHLLSGLPPFVVKDGDNRAETLKRRTVAGHPRPAMDRRDVPPGLIELLRSMMATDPRTRPQSMRDVHTRIVRLRSDMRFGAAHVGDVEAEPAIEDTVLRSPPERVDPRLEDDRTVFRTGADTGTAAKFAANYVGPGYAASGLANSSTQTSYTLVPDQIQPDATGEPQDVAAPTLRPASRVVRSAVIAGAVVLAVAIGVGVAVTGSGGGTQAGGTTPSAGASIAGAGDAGLIGENEPPGPVSVTATRTGGDAVRFAWTYSANLASDSYRWQTPDGKQHGVLHVRSLDLPDPSGTRLCIEVKVVRIDGSDGDPGWSPPGCVS